MVEGFGTLRPKPIWRSPVKDKAQKEIHEVREARLEQIRQRIRKSISDTRPSLDSDEAEAEMARFMSRER